MSDLQIERSFPVSPDHLFAWVTKPDNLTKWWGPEGMYARENELDFTRLGPWFAVIVNDQGGTHKVSGQVTRVDVPNMVGFTWAWHDDEDRRGEESHVTFTIVPDGDGAKLVLNHRGLGDDERSRNHEYGWTSSLRSLAAEIS